MDDKKKTMEEKVSTAKTDEGITDFEDFRKKVKTDAPVDSDIVKTAKEKTEAALKEESKDFDEEKPIEEKAEGFQKKRPAAEKREAESEEKESVAEKKEVESKEKKSVAEGKYIESEEKECVSKGVQSKDSRTVPKEMLAASREDSFLQAKKKKRKPLVACLIIVVLFLVVYVAGFVYFSGHFYPNAEINGIPVSNMVLSTARQVLDDFYKNYTLTLETIDGERIVIDGKDISMQIELHDEFNSCLEQQKPYIWFVNIFKHHDYKVGTDVAWDEAALSDCFNSMKILDERMMTAPQDAYIAYKDDKLTIVKEVMGNEIITGIFKKMVKESLSNVQSVLILADTGCYNLPKVYDTDEGLKSELEAKQELVGNEIKLQLDDITLEPGIELYDAVLEKKGNSYEVSKKLVEKYVASLAEQYDTLGKDRTFITSFNNKKIEVNGTAFGYEMNQEETVNALYKALTGGKPATVEVLFDNKGYTLQGENDIGDTYVEVNLSEQRVIAYKNGKKIAEGDCVSGNESAGNGTCIGLYAIQNKLSPTVLRGEKKPVTKTVTKKKNGKKVKEKVTTYQYEYESPVTFWMQFNGGIGLHDAAQWRSVYGGSIYYYSGSHGCVNLPYDLAETLYKNFEIGDPVVVYFWDNENRK